MENKVLQGIIGLHVDDILAAGDESLGAQLEDVHKIIGFVSVKKKKFTRYGKEYEKIIEGPDRGQIHISMKGFIHTMEIMKVPVGRASRFQEPLTARGNHD